MSAPRRRPAHRPTSYLIPTLTGPHVTASLPAAGRLRVDWYAGPARGAKRPTLVAYAATWARHAGTVTVTIALTRAGRAFLTGARAPALTARVSFRPIHGRRLASQRRVVLADPAVVASLLAMPFTEGRGASATPAVRPAGGAGG